MRPRTRAARPSPRRRAKPKPKPKGDPWLWVFVALVLALTFMLGWKGREAYDRAQRTVTIRPGPTIYIWPAPTDEEKRRQAS